MDTKWKNMVKAIKKFIKEYYDCVFGFLLFIIGSFLFFVVLVNRYYFSTWGVWRICLIGNILVQPGICLLVRRYMKLRYRNWSQKGSAETYLQDTEDSIYYQTWKAKENMISHSLGSQMEFTLSVLSPGNMRELERSLSDNSLKMCGFFRLLIEGETNHETYSYHIDFESIGLWNNIFVCTWRL